MSTTDSQASNIAFPTVARKTPSSGARSPVTTAQTRKLAVTRASLGRDRRKFLHRQLLRDESAGPKEGGHHHGPCRVPSPAFAPWLERPHIRVTPCGKRRALPGSALASPDQEFHAILSYHHQSTGDRTSSNAMTCFYGNNKPRQKISLNNMYRRRHRAVKTDIIRFWYNCRVASQIVKEGKPCSCLWKETTSFT